jgi:hypothetical protein
MSLQEARLSKLLKLADEIESLRFCGPSDDLDQQSAVTYGFKHLVKKFIGTARRINNQEFQEDLQLINTNIDSIYEVYDLSADVQILIDHLREIAEHPVEFQSTSSSFVDPQIIEQLRLVENSMFDLSKVIRFCEELNSSFNASNYLASTLLLRAIINHIPPIFGHTTFQQVVSQVSKSRRELFKPLDQVARDVADLHTHDLIRHKEVLPSKNQLEPFKVNLEVLLQEVLVELQKDNSSSSYQPY